LTNDVDVVVDLPEQKIGEFCASFPEGEFYVSEESLDRAVRQRWADQMGLETIWRTIKYLVRQKQ